MSQGLGSQVALSAAATFRTLSGCSLLRGPVSCSVTTQPLSSALTKRGKPLGPTPEDGRGHRNSLNIGHSGGAAVEPNASWEGGLEAGLALQNATQGCECIGGTWRLSYSPWYLPSHTCPHLTQQPCALCPRDFRGAHHTPASPPATQSARSLLHRCRHLRRSEPAGKPTVRSVGRQTFHKSTYSLCLLPSRESPSWVPKQSKLATRQQAALESHTATTMPVCQPYP